MYKIDAVSITSMYEDVDLTVRNEPNEFVEGKSAPEESISNGHAMTCRGQCIAIVR